MLAEGVCIAGRYRLLGLLGEGGMASVWRAEDQRLERPVAVKFLDTKLGRDATEATAQFLREAKIAAAVSHRNVIQTVDFGTTDTGQPFMVMELLQGRTLAERIAMTPQLSIEESVRIALLTLRGLSKVHEAGIVHRDLKPDNIFLVEDADGTFPKILDFGISRSVDPNSGRKSALTTSEGLIVGTPEYMSAEQARGLRDLDLRTDIYSMGVILYECLTGKRPYESEHTGDLIIMVVNGGAPPVIELRPDVGQALSDVVARAMSRKREARFADARAMQRALEAAISATPSADDGIRQSVAGIAPQSTSSDPDAGLEYELPISQPAGVIPAAAELRTADTMEHVAVAHDTFDQDSPLRSTSPTQQGIESWTDIQRAQSNPWGRWLGIAGAIVFVVAVGIWALGPSDDVEPTTLAAGTGPSPTTPSLEPHVVELQGLPAGATILLDGKPAVGPHVTLPPGEEEKHTIQVLAPGMMPWFVVHGPGSQHRYDVLMSPMAAPEPAATDAPTPSATKPARTNKTSATAPQQTATTGRTTTNTSGTSTPAKSTPAKSTPTKSTKTPTKSTPTTPPTAFRNLDF